MKPKKKTAKSKSKRPKMPKFFPIDDEMKELSALLENEISDWPWVSKKPMFGYQGLYRDGVIFAALPRSRAMKSPRSIMFKFASVTPAIRSEEHTSELQSRRDLVCRLLLEKKKEN